jgi:hypothetical protein
VVRHAANCVATSLGVVCCLWFTHCDGAAFKIDMFGAQSTLVCAWKPTPSVHWRNLPKTPPRQLAPCLLGVLEHGYE